MPLYEYECEANGHRFERIQKFSDPPVEVCPECGGKVNKLMSSPAVQFKGTGWYVTDYAGKGKEKSAKDATKDSADATKGKDTSESTTKDAPGAKKETTETKTKAETKAET
jgi:putative FmdB family regulatory protein